MPHKPAERLDKTGYRQESVFSDRELSPFGSSTRKRERRIVNLRTAARRSGDIGSLEPGEIPSSPKSDTGETVGRLVSSIASGTSDAIRDFTDSGADSTRLRVCIINEFFWPDSTGGTGTIVSDLVGALRERHGSSIDLSVITSSNLYRSPAGQPKVDLPLRDEWMGVPIRRVPCPSAVGKSPVPRLIANFLFGWRALSALLASHREQSCDLLVVATAPPTLAAIAAIFRRLTGRPFLYIIYDLDPDRAVVMNVLSKRSPFAKVLRILQRQWLHQADRVVVLGRCMSDYLGSAYGLSKAQIDVIPIGSDPGEFNSLSRSDSAFRSSPELNKAFVVLYAGNFGRYHNFDTILDAAKILADRAPQIRFVLAGGGAKRESVEQRVADENIENIKLLPFIERARYGELLAAADATLVTLEPGMEGLCVPSKFYGLLAAGRPVIALTGETSEISRVLNEEKCGIRVDSTDAAGLAEAILRIAQNPDEADKMGLRGRDAVMRRFTTKHVADLYAESFFAAAGRAKPSGVTAAKVVHELSVQSRIKPEIK